MDALVAPASVRGDLLDPRLQSATSPRCRLGPELRVTLPLQRAVPPECKRGPEPGKKATPEGIPVSVCIPRTPPGPALGTPRGDSAVRPLTHARDSASPWLNLVATSITPPSLPAPHSPDPWPCPRRGGRGALGLRVRLDLLGLCSLALEQVKTRLYRDYSLGAPSHALL